VEVQASIPGIFRTVLIIIGAIVLLRFLGQFMIAKRNMEEERQLSKLQRKYDQERTEKMKNFGKVNVIRTTQSKTPKIDVEDVDFEEIH
jgi:hypothetical protein